MNNNLEKNIVLIGMPGCGKTTIGKLLSERLEISFYDVDNYIEFKEKMSISDIFKKGEDYFRRLESEAVSDIVKKTAPMIIATGGGVIKNEGNIELLRENSIIIFINRPIENIISDIDIKKRPLLKQSVLKLYELYNERYELYKMYCNYEVLDDESLEIVLEEIMKFLVNLKGC